MHNVIRGSKYLEDVKWEDQDFALWKKDLPFDIDDELLHKLYQTINQSVDFPIELSYNKDSAGEFISSYVFDQKLHEWPEMQNIVQWIEAAFSGHHITEMWANKTEPGGFLKAHNHAGNKYAGTIYVKVPDNSGDIIMNGHCRGNIKQGDVIVFDGQVSHKTEINNSDSDRLVMAFTLEEKNEI